MLTVKQIQKNPLVLEFLRQTEKKLKTHNYTEHGIRHSKLVSDRARTIAREIGLSEKDQELSAVSGYCHDFANFLSRTYHNYLGSVMFQQMFSNDFSPKDLAVIMQAIANHDKYEMNFSNSVCAITVLADKSDVSRDRVTVKDTKIIQEDIHNRVNYAVRSSKLEVDKRKKEIVLYLEVNTSFVPVIEYFEIFTQRMTYCRRAAKFLGYKFSLVINNFRLC